MAWAISFNANFCSSIAIWIASAPNFIFPASELTTEFISTSAFIWFFKSRIVTSIVLTASMICPMRLTVLLIVTLPFSISSSFCLIIELILLILLLVFEARVATSSATTANPFPASPALAASMAAFNASKFICLDIPFIISITLVICLELLLIFWMLTFILCRDIFPTSASFVIELIFLEALFTLRFMLWIKLESSFILLNR